MLIFKVFNFEFAADKILCFVVEFLLVVLSLLGNPLGMCLHVCARDYIIFFCHALETSVALRELRI